MMMTEKQLARPEEPAEMRFTPAQVELIKRTVARGATDDELALFLYQARRTGLDPLTRQLHFVKRKQRQADGSYAEVGAIQVGIDGFRVVAERTGKYAGQLGPLWCGQDGKWVDVWLSDQPPAAAKVAVLRRDFAEPLWAVARYEAYVQRTSSGPTSMWARMADLMLAKCAEALAIRKAFPLDLSGLYAHEEMAQADSVEVRPVGATVQEVAVVREPAGEVKPEASDEEAKAQELRRLYAMLRGDPADPKYGATNKGLTADEVDALLTTAATKAGKSLGDFTAAEVKDLAAILRRVAPEKLLARAQELMTSAEGAP